MKHILIIASYGPSLINFRLPLIKKLLSRGHKVSVASPVENFSDNLQKELNSKKIELIKKDYPDKKAAKMFYDILVEGIKKYSIEIRWKGNVFCSPQIIIQKV